MNNGLIGHPLSHSYSKFIHELINQVPYELYDLNYNELEGFIKNNDFNGLNVTIPYKEKVMKYLDYLDPKAKKIHAVNTIIKDGDCLKGYNTDYFGFRFLLNFNHVSLKDKNILILGTGATSKTVYAACLDLGCKNVLKITRKLHSNWVSYDELYQNDYLLRTTDLIINTTPVGMYPNVNEKNIDLTKFKKLSTVIDVIYNPYKTNLLIDAKKLRIKYVNGLVMLVAQAVYAESLFIHKNTDNFPKLNDLIIKTYHKVLLEETNLVIIGMPGSGKTTIGKRIAYHFDIPFYDLDEAFKYKYKMAPYEVINKEGEITFRKMETDILKEYAGIKKCVIATGGGIVTKDENYDLIKHNSIIIYLNRKPNFYTLMNNRPLSKDPAAWDKLYQKRKNLYLAWKDYEIKSLPRKSDTVDKIIARIK